MRAETGIMIFEGDWPGVYLRGDNALATAFWLEQVINKSESGQVLGEIDLRRMRGLLSLLYSCDQRLHPVCQIAELIFSPPSAPPTMPPQSPGGGS